MARKRMTTVFRDLMDKRRLIVAPGAYDPLSAKIIESVGFEAVYVTGSGSSAGFLAKPDLGFTTLTELTNLGHRIASAINIPVIHDSEAGFGTAIHVTRTIEEWIAAGVAGVHIEDQLTSWYHSPGWMGVKPDLMSMEAFAGKIKAAVAARDEIDPDFVIIARTDAGDIGYDEVVKRCNAYLGAGADMAMIIHSPMFRGKSREECIDIYRRTVKDIKGPVYALGFEAHGLTVKDVEKMGYKLYATPTMTVMAAARAIRDVVLEMKENGTPAGYWKKFPPIPSAEFESLKGSEKYLEIYKKYMTVPRDY